MTTNAPVIKNADGSYSPVDDSVVCRDNVCVFYAPIDADYSHSFYETENASFAETMDAWRALSDKLYLWLYSTNFHYYLYPFNSFNSMQEITGSRSTAAAAICSTRGSGTIPTPRAGEG